MNRPRRVISDGRSVIAGAYILSRLLNNGCCTETDTQIETDAERAAREFAENLLNGNIPVSNGNPNPDDNRHPLEDPNRQPGPLQPPRLPPDNPDDPRKTVVVLGAGGWSSKYTNDAVKFVAPASQLAAVLRSFPGWEVLSVDLGAGGVKEFLSGDTPNDVVNAAAQLYGFDLSIPDSAANLLTEFTTSYGNFSIGDKKADVVISFYPDGESRYLVVSTAENLLKSRGKFYAIVDIAGYKDSIYRDLKNGNWNVPTVMPGGYNNPRTAAWSIIHAGNNPFGLKGFASAQYVYDDLSKDAYDVYAERK